MRSAAAAVSCTATNTLSGNNAAHAPRVRVAYAQAMVKDTGEDGLRFDEVGLDEVKCCSVMSCVCAVR